MTKEEFFDLAEKFPMDSEVKIRYYTYNKNHYMDIIGKIFSFSEARDGSGCLTFTYIGVLKYHDKNNGTNIPKLGIQLFSKHSIAPCSQILSSQISFIKPASLRAYKIHQIRNKKG